MKKLYRVAAIQELQQPNMFGTQPNTLLQVFLQTVELSLEHKAPPSPIAQLRSQLDKAGMPADVQKMVIDVTGSFGMPWTGPLNQPTSVLFVTQTEYEQMGKPTVGQHLVLETKMVVVDDVKPAQPEQASTSSG